MKQWEVTFKYTAPADGLDVSLGLVYGVVEREDERTIRTIASRLTREEAHAVANSRESLTALEKLWDAIHREDSDDFDSEKIKSELLEAFDVLLRAKGVKL